MARALDHATSRTPDAALLRRQAARDAVRQAHQSFGEALGAHRAPHAHGLCRSDLRLVGGTALSCGEEQLWVGTEAVRPGPPLTSSTHPAPPRVSGTDADLTLVRKSAMKPGSPAPTGVPTNS